VLLQLVGGWNAGGGGVAALAVVEDLDEVEHGIRRARRVAQASRVGARKSIVGAELQVRPGGHLTTMISA
jgi:hypothetical protein